MTDLDEQINALNDRFEREQRQRQAMEKAADLADDRAHKAMIAAVERVKRQAEIDRGDVTIHTFTC